MFRRKDKNGKGNWYCHHPVTGLKFSLGTDNKVWAKERLRKLEEEAQDRKVGRFVENWEDVANRWMELNPHLANRAAQESYHAFWLQHLTGTKLSLIDESLVHDLITRYFVTRGNRVNLKERTPGNATANLYVGFVGKILRCGRVVPPRFHKYPVTEQSKGALRPEQWLTLKAALPEPHRLLCSFALSTGLRIENVMGLEWSWVHGDKLYLPASVTKTAQDYGIPLNRSAMSVIEELKRQPVRHQTYVFTYHGQPWYYRTLLYVLKRTSEKCLGFPITPHWFRHTFRSWLAQQGVSDSISRRLGCWKLGRGADSKYLHFDVEPLRRFSEILDPLVSVQSHGKESAHG